jgi:hypothetical protein
MSGTTIVLAPFGVTAATTARRLAPRPGSLRGKRIGVLDNSKPNAGALLVRVAELLAERTGAASIRRWTKPGASVPSREIDAIAGEVDVVLTGSAD